MDESWQRAVLRKVGWRLLPFLFLLYVVNILDRGNVSFARLHMLEDMGLSDRSVQEAVYGFGAGLFYVGYFVFEIPSNLILRRVGARRWLGRILITWGLVTAATLLVSAPVWFYLLRILLGLAEAGFFPGMILYLTYWFPAHERARVVGLLMAGSPLTGVLQGPLAGAILQYLNGWGGLAGWQWLFLLEGAPAVLLGFVTLRYLTDRPAQAGWLAPAERDWLAAHVGLEEQERERRHGLTLLGALVHRRVWLLTALYFTIAVGANAFGFYLPTLLKDRFPGRGDFEIGLLSAIPNVCAALAMVLNGFHSDRTGERRWHVAVPAFVAAAGWALCARAGGSPLLSLLALTLAQVGCMCMLPAFWTLPTAFLTGAAAAGGIALINSVGNFGGLTGPNILGQSAALTGSFTGGLVILAMVLALGGLLALGVRAHDLRAGDPTRP
jgi:ACS family tartrate transporter-like MFS transporter